MPDIKFDVQAGNAFAVLQTFYQQVQGGSIALEHMAVNFTKVNGKGDEYVTSISGVTATNQKLTASIKETTKGIEIMNLKLTETPKAAAASRKAMASALKIADAKTARGVLEGQFGTGELGRDQTDAVRSRISQIASSIERGKVQLSEFQNAVAVSVGTLATGSLNETEQKVLNIIKRIETTTTKAADKLKQKADASRTLTANQRFGAATAIRYNRNNADAIDRLDPAAQERVRRQFEQLQNLFAKGLDKTGFQRALAAIQNNTIGTLTKIEGEARHRIEQINNELEKGNKGGGFLDKLFGGGAGGTGGLVGAAGGTQAVVGGLLLAQGVDRAAESIKAAAQDTADFQKQISLLRTLSQDTAESFNDWQASILRVSSAVGKSKEEIASSGLDLLSNQITKGVGDTEEALTKASQFATATNSTVSDSVNLLSSVLQSFSLDASHTDEVLGKLFTTIDLGRIKASDLANTMGRPAVAAASLGFSLDELNAAMITISQTGLGVEQTNTLITNVFHKLLNPTEELQKHFNDLGVGTGEMYAKQLGLVGVLEDLIKTTHGSTAELSKYFNEIRGEQGIVQLTSRIKVLKEAIREQQKDGSYKFAVQETQQNPGQRFAEQITTYTNAFTELKGKALKIILDITDSVGGLSEALINASRLTIGLGTVLGGLYAAHIFKYMTGEVLTFKAALGATIPLIEAALPFAAGFAIGATVGSAITNVYDALYEKAHSAEILAERAQENAKNQTDAAATINAKMASANEAQLKIMQSQALSYVSKVKSALDNLASAQKVKFQSVAEELKNSFELVGQALKRIITQGEEQERRLVDSILKGRERLRDSKDDSKDSLFNARIARNRLRVGLGSPDLEGVIQKRRISELSSEAAKLALTGRPQDTERALELNQKALAIARERRDATTPISFNGGTADIPKYLDGFKNVNILEKERIRLIIASQNAMAKREETQRKQNETDRAAAKQLQDAANKVTSFKLFDETNKPIYRTPEKAREEYQRRLTDYDKTVNDVVNNQNVTPAARVATAKTQGDLLESQKAQIKAYREILEMQLDTFRAQEANKRQGENVTKQFENQIAKVKDLKNVMNQASKEMAQFGEQAKASFGALEANATRSPVEIAGKFFANVANFDDLGNVKGVTPQDLGPKIPKPVQNLLGLGKAALGQNDPVEALKMVDLAQAKLKELGATEEEMLDKQGNVTTVGDFIKKLRVDLNLTIAATKQFQAAGIVSDNQVAQGRQFVDLLTSFAGKYGNVEAAAEQFATVAAKSFKSVTGEAGEMISNLNMMLRQLDEMTNVAENITKASVAARAGINPSLVAPGTSGQLVGPPKPVAPVPASEFFGGAIGHYAEGGFVQDFMNGKYARGSDRHPAMLADGESVNNSQATSRFAAQIIAMNAGFEPSFAGSKKAAGHQYNIGDIHVHVKSGDSAAKTTRDLGAAMKREIRRGSLNL